MRRLAIIGALIHLLALKLGSSFPITSTSSAVAESVYKYQANNHDGLIISDLYNDKVVKVAANNNRRRAAGQNIPFISSIAAITVFAVQDTAFAVSNDAVILTSSFQNTRQVPVASVSHPIPASKTHYSFSVLIDGVGGSATSSVKDVILEGNRRISQQMKEVGDKDNQSTINDVIGDEDDRMTQQMEDVGVTRKIEAATTANDVREEAQKVIQQNTLTDHGAQQANELPKKGNGASTTSSKHDTQQNTRPTEIENIEVTNLEKIAAENKIDVELKDTKADTSVKIDRENFTKVKVVQPPFLRYLPSSVQPLISSQFRSVQVLKSIPDEELFLASVVAGSLTEIIRTALLYPLSTVKARIQARSSRSTSKKRTLLRKLKITWLTFLYETKKGGLYDGVVPSLIITVPASGVFAGTKEVAARAFRMAIPFVQAVLTHYNESVSTVYCSLFVSLLAAFVADIAALALMTPADVLSLRLQVFGDNNVNADLGSWFKDSISLLPVMVITDLPYLMSRIFLNLSIMTSGEKSLADFEAITIVVACVCALLTTPFDVARTRILLSARDMESDELTQRRLVAPSKYREQRRQQVSVSLTMKRITAEGNGGMKNLFNGWLERTLYLGVGRAWLDPLRIIAYLGARDAILLNFFE